MKIKVSEDVQAMPVEWAAIKMLYSEDKGYVELDNGLEGLEV